MEYRIDKATEQICDNILQPENEYIGEDGLLYCSKCHKRVQTVFNVPTLGINKIVRCICDCKRKELAEIKEREWQEELNRRRIDCFAETNMANWSFANDDFKNPKLSEAMKRYAENFEDFKKDGKGILLYGPCGTGKTYYAACIANRLLDAGYRVKMTNFARLVNQIQGMFEGKQEFIDSINRFALLVIDDLGAERSSEYMQEMIFNIIDSRYRSGKPMIITTNLTAEEFRRPKSIGTSRIYDRILERCHPVEVSGMSRRRGELRDSFMSMNERLGLEGKK